MTTLIAALRASWLSSCWTDVSADLTESRVANALRSASTALSAGEGRPPLIVENSYRCRMSAKQHPSRRGSRVLTPLVMLPRCFARSTQRSELATVASSR